LKAQFTNVRPQQTLKNGMSGELKCSGVGTPFPQFEWKRHGNKTFDKGRFTPMPNGSLFVKPVLPRDKGLYTCTMKQSKKHSIGTESQVINVFVIGM